MKLEQKADAVEVLPSMARRQLSCLHSEGLPVLLVLVVEVVAPEFEEAEVFSEAMMAVLTEKLERPPVEIDRTDIDEELPVMIAVTDVDIELALP